MSGTTSSTTITTFRKKTEGSLKKHTALALFLTLSLFSCASVERKETEKLSIKTLNEKCKELVGKKVKLSAKYMGWKCPQNCKNPGITRSDTCFVDSSGCIYAEGLAGLDPLIDKGKIISLEALVKEKRGICYLEVLKEDEVR